MAAMMRAKMRVAQITKSNGVEILRFNAVGRSDNYPQDGSDENNSYAKWTPQGDCSLTVANPLLFGSFAEGDEFYLDFTKAEK